MNSFWTNTATDVAPPLTQWRFMVNCLSMGYGTHDSDARWAFKCWGGLGFAGHRKRRRERLLALAEKMATEVGHGDTPRPMVILPTPIFLPMAFVEEAERLFGTRLPPSLRRMLPHDDLCDAVLLGMGPGYADTRRWTTPEIRDARLCENCDGAPDGGHVGDELCVRTLEEWTEWEYCPWK